MCKPTTPENTMLLLLLLLLLPDAAARMRSPSVCTVEMRGAETVMAHECGGRTMLVKSVTADEERSETSTAAADGAAGETSWGCSDPSRARERKSYNKENGM